jgi:hypothetical protein
MGLIQ